MIIKIQHSGGTIPIRGKKKGREEDAMPLTSGKEPGPTGRPLVYFAGLVTLLVGLFIAIGSLVHNNLKIFVNETSDTVYGPYDWGAAIIGAVVLLVGIILLILSRGTSRSS